MDPAHQSMPQNRSFPAERGQDDSVLGETFSSKHEISAAKSRGHGRSLDRAPIAYPLPHESASRPLVKTENGAVAQPRARKSDDFRAMSAEV